MVAGRPFNDADTSNRKKVAVIYQTLASHFFPRRRYLEHLAAQGAALHTLRGAAGIIYRAAIWMRLDESSPVERKEVERAAKRWARSTVASDFHSFSCRSPSNGRGQFLDMRVEKGPSMPDRRVDGADAIELSPMLAGRG